MDAYTKINLSVKTAVNEKKIFNKSNKYSGMVASSLVIIVIVIIISYLLFEIINSGQLAHSIMLLNEGAKDLGGMNCSPYTSTCVNIDDTLSTSSIILNTEN
ncbi:hypothetical protein GQX74_003785 [Glossina fuscipes]|nr:hypothetical protein GQX74_003785 [Glossina fuscipes]